MTRDVRIGVALVVALGVFTAAMLLIGSLGAPRPEVDPLSVTEAMARAGELGDEEVHVSGWYAELDAECEGDAGGSDPDVAWLQRDCPLRVLLPAQPPPNVSQEQLLRDGVRLAAPQDGPFPARAQPDGPNLRGQQLVFIGHFDDPAAESCVPDRVERCRRTLVVSDYEEQVR